jgi:hypothetical protein
MKKEMNKILMVLLLASIVLVASAGAASAQNYYVSTNGNDGNNGHTMKHAFGSIEHGSSQLTAGDTLYIDGGTYHNDEISIASSGTKNKWVTVTNYNNEDVLLQHSKEFNTEDGITGLCGKSYIKIENVHFSHYGSVAYISGKYTGNTHNMKFINTDSYRSYERAFCCNAGAHDMLFKDILIEHVEHPSSSPNAFDFLTSPHDKDYKPNKNYKIYNIKCDNVDIDYVESHNGFNFGQGVSVSNYDQHWDGILCDNFHFDGCDVDGAAGAGYYTNKYVLRNSVIENCDVTDCWNGLGLIGNDLLIKNVHSHDNDMNDMFFLWDAESRDVVIECFKGDKPGLSNKDGFTVIGCGESSDQKPKKPISKLLNEYDTNNNNRIDINEVQTAYVDHHNDKITVEQRDEIMRYFLYEIPINDKKGNDDSKEIKKYDTNNNKRIDINEVQNAYLDHNGGKITIELRDEIMRYFLYEINV